MPAKRYRCPLSLIMLLLPLTSPLYADDETQLNALLDLLQEQTTIATQTRLNADYVPGILTVLHGDRLERYGIKTVWEALSLVPGIENGMEETGREQVVIRGIGRTYASGNIKFLLDGVAMNNAALGYASPVLRIPTSQIERIEVIRGPGSAVHGEYAYSGVVNVITRKQPRIHLRAASGQDYQLGLSSHYQADNQPFSLDLSLGLQQERGVTVRSGKDILYPQGFAQVSHAPGPTNEIRRDTQLLLAAKYQDTQLQLQWLEHGHGDHFGVNFNLPPNDKHIAYRQRQQAINLQHVLFRNDEVETNLRFGWMETEHRADQLYGGYFYDADLDILFGPDRIDSRYREQRSQLGADLIWRGWKGQQWLLAWQGDEIAITHSHMQASDPWGIWMDGEHPLYPSDKVRRIQSLTLQDEIRLNDAFTLTTGLRYDHYSDVGNNLSPRLAGVWRINPRHIFKAQYAKAFRPPTFYEQGGAAYYNETLDPASIHTSELSYIYKGLDQEYHLSLFHSLIRDQVVAGYDENGDYGYHNIGHATAQGIELEWDQTLSSQFRLQGNLSWLHSREELTEQALSGSNRWLGNIALEYRVNPDWWLAMRYRYTGRTAREAEDARSSLRGYQLVDLTLSHEGFIHSGSRLRMGVKNLFDREVKVPAPIATYADDLPRPGRVWWLALEHHF